MVVGLTTLNVVAVEPTKTSETPIKPEPVMVTVSPLSQTEVGAKLAMIGGVFSTTTSSTYKTQPSAGSASLTKAR